LIDWTLLLILIVSLLQLNGLLGSTMDYCKTIWFNQYNAIMDFRLKVFLLWLLD
jgi:hypothetical protein